MKITKFTLILLVASVGIHRLDYLQSLFTGFEIKSLIRITPLFLPPILIFVALITYSLRSRFRPTSLHRPFVFQVFIFSLFIVFLILYGGLIGNLPFFIGTDVWIYFVVVCALLLGRYQEVWRDLEKILPWFFLIYFFAVVLAIPFPKRELLESGSIAYWAEQGVDLGNTATLAYDISPVLDIWPLIFVMAMVTPKRKISLRLLLGLLSMFMYLGLQLFFAKRAPSVRAISYLLATILFYQYVFPRSIKGVKYGIGAVVGVILLLSTVSIDGLLDKFNRRKDDNSRQTEISIMFSQLTAYEWFIGKGMGGYFTLGRANDDYGLGAYPVNNKGDIGKTLMHIGAGYPFLKGGLIFFFLHLLFLFPLLLRLFNKNWLKNKYNFTAVVVLFVYSFFRLIEGPFSTGHSFDGIIFGLCCGKLSTA